MKPDYIPRKSGISWSCRSIAVRRVWSMKATHPWSVGEGFDNGKEDSGSCLRSRLPGAAFSTEKGWGAHLSLLCSEGLLWSLALSVKPTVT